MKRTYFHNPRVINRGTHRRTVTDFYNMTAWHIGDKRSICRILESSLIFHIRYILRIIIIIAEDNCRELRIMDFQLWKISSETCKLIGFHIILHYPPSAQTRAITRLVIGLAVWRQTDCTILNQLPQYRRITGNMQIRKTYVTQPGCI